MKAFHALVARLRGRNSASTPASVILDQLTELRPLPLGVAEYQEWSERIWKGACIPGATLESTRFALAAMIMHAKPTDDHICDGYFIKCLRKGAANQVAHSFLVLEKAEEQARQAERAAAAEAARPKIVPPAPPIDGVTD